MSPELSKYVGILMPNRIFNIQRLIRFYPTGELHCPFEVISTVALNNDINIAVTRVLQTAQGRMIFAQPKEPVDERIRR